MKFVNKLGIIEKARRFVSSASSVQDGEVQSPTKLAEIIRSLTARITELESKSPGEGTEFEISDVGAAGADVNLFHSYGKPVRYYVVYWATTIGGTLPTTGPELVAQSDSTNDNLHLKSYVSGRAVIRVEPAEAGIER